MRSEKKTHSGLPVWMIIFLYPEFHFLPLMRISSHETAFSFCDRVFEFKIIIEAVIHFIGFEEKFSDREPGEQRDRPCPSVRVFERQFFSEDEEGGDDDAHVNHHDDRFKGLDGKNVEEVVFIGSESHRGGFFNAIRFENATIVTQERDRTQLCTSHVCQMAGPIVYSWAERKAFIY